MKGKPDHEKLHQHLEPLQHFEDDGPEVQVNIRLSSHLKAALFHICEAQGISATEAITRLIHGYVEHHATRIPQHVDGTTCPLAKFVSELTAALVAPYVSDYRKTDHAKR